MTEEKVIKNFLISVCEDCFNLKGEMCRTPECIFCFSPISKIKETLNACLIRPCVDGRFVDMGNYEDAGCLLDEAAKLITDTWIRNTEKRINAEYRQSVLRLVPADE